MFTDINVTLVFFQVLNLVIFAAWIVLVLRALRQLNNTRMSESLKLIWAFLIVTVPVLGAIAFLTVRPNLLKATA